MAQTLYFDWRIIMNFEQAQAYLFASFGEGRKKGHGALLQALAAFGNPQEKLKIIHVAGTNGKGSFCKLMASILHASGLKVGVFTSPHMEVFNERLTINDAMITDEDFTAIMGHIAHISSQMFDGGDSFSFFEIWTLLAFIYFYKKEVDILLLEVGIGGRLDSTNVITSPLLSVIMSIGMDHMALLGNTIEEIAKEKGGIIKPNRPVALHDDQALVGGIFNQMADAAKAKQYLAKGILITSLEMGVDGSSFVAHLPDAPPLPITLGLVGDYQVENAKTALAACIALRDLGLNIQIEHIQKGLKNAKHPCRMEIVKSNPPIVLEGSHNMQGVAACIKNMKALFPNQSITLLVAVLADKEFDEMINALAAIASKIVFTKPVYDFKAASTQALASSLRSFDGQVFLEDDCSKALKIAKDITCKNGVILCTGSLYLAGDIRRVLKQEGGGKAI